MKLIQKREEQQLQQHLDSEILENSLKQQLKRSKSTKDITMYLDLGW